MPSARWWRRPSPSRKLTEPDPDLLPLAAPADYQRVERWFEATARATPEERARAVAEAIRVVEAAGQTAAGIYSTGESVFALLNSRGVLARHTRDHGALLHHRHGGGQFRMGQGQRLRSRRPQPVGTGPDGRAQSRRIAARRASCRRAAIP